VLTYINKFFTIYFVRALRGAFCDSTSPSHQHNALYYLRENIKHLQRYRYKKLPMTSNDFFIINMWGIFTCLGPKGLSSGITNMQNYLEATRGYGWFVYKWGLIVAINRFIIKGNWVYKGKGKGFPLQALEWGEWSAACPGRTLPPGKTWYPLYRRLGGPLGWSGGAENLVSTRIRSRTVQPVVSHYTD